MDNDERNRFPDWQRSVLIVIFMWPASIFFRKLLQPVHPYGEIIGAVGGVLVIALAVWFLFFLFERAYQ